MGFYVCQNLSVVHLRFMYSIECYSTSIKNKQKPKSRISGKRVTNKENLEHDVLSVMLETCIKSFMGECGRGIRSLPGHKSPGLDLYVSVTLLYPSWHPLSTCSESISFSNGRLRSKHDETILCLP